MSDCLGGYFKFSVASDGLYLTVYPPKVGGRKASIDDFMFYIEKRKIADCSLIKAKEAFTATDAPKTVKVSDITVFPSNEFGEYRITSDSMTVEAKFYPPFEGAGELSEQEIIKDLQSIGVKYGMDNLAIQQFLKEKEYLKEYILARGLAPKEGKDCEIVYNFNTDLKPTPKIKEDGSVDFHTLDNVNHIKAGDILATIIPEDSGVPGIDIFNRTIQPQRVRKIILRTQKHTKVSIDGLTLISEVNGHVTLENDKVLVSNVLELSNVDNSTGDIDYEGSIVIKGNILAGFSVKSAEDILVNGIIEGSKVFAAGNITIFRGIQGMNRAVIQAGGNIVTKFIESAESIIAGGNIETDTILHSKVIAKGRIIVNGRNGLIIGGDVKSSSLIEAKTIGNEMGTATTVGVGVDPSVKKRLDELKKELDKSGNNKIQLSQLITALRKKQEVFGTLDPDKQKMLQNTMKSLIILEQLIASDKRELEECRMQLTEDSGARIKVFNNAYPGIKFVFGEQYLFLREKYTYCQFMKVGPDIASIPL